MTYREEEAMIARAGAKCFYTNRRPARKCSNKVGVRFCPSPCEHKVEPQYAIPVTDCAALLKRWYETVTISKQLDSDRRAAYVPAFGLCKETYYMGKRDLLNWLSLSCQRPSKKPDEK